VLSGSPWDALITKPEESRRVRCVRAWLWSLYNEVALAHWRLLCSSVMVKPLQWGGTGPLEAVVPLLYIIAETLASCLSDSPDQDGSRRCIHRCELSIALFINKNSFLR
jgi:hypothetical protein